MEKGGDVIAVFRESINNLKFTIMLYLPKKAIPIFFSLALFIVSCSNPKNVESMDDGIETKEQQTIQTRNAEAWDDAAEMTFSDKDFLKTREPMSEEAIEPFDYNTGLVGDKAYNRRVYVEAINRIKKHSYIKDNQVYTDLKSGAEVNIAEDLFEYIVNKLYREWNTALNEGRYEIVFDEKEYFNMMPVKKKTEVLSTPYDLLYMSHLQRLNTLKTIYDMNPTGPLGNYVVLNFGKELTGYSGNNQYFVQNGCVAFGNPDYNCNHNQIAYSNSAYYSDRVIYKVYNTNHLVLITVQIVT